MKKIYIARRRVAGEVEGLHIYRNPPFLFDNIEGAVDTLEYWARRCSCGDCSRLLAGAFGWTGGAERAFGLQGSQKSGLAVATLRPAHSPPEDPHQWVGAMYSECGDHLYVEIVTVNQGRGPGHPCES